jgi:hypothetical protein
MSTPVICKSGVRGRQGKLRRNYSDFQEFLGYCDLFNLHVRLGYQTPMTCWRANPIIQWSVNPGDFIKAPKQKSCSTPKNKKNS